MLQISPINQAIIEKAKLNNNQNQIKNSISTQTPTSQIEQSSTQLSAKSSLGLIDKLKANKKGLIIATLGICAMTTAIIFAVKKGLKTNGADTKIDEIAKNGEEIIAQGRKTVAKGNEIIQEGNKQLEEVMSLIQDGEKNGFQDVVDDSGKVVRKFYKNAMHGEMNEFDGDKIIRKTTFFGDKEVYSITKGIELTPEGKYKFDEEYIFQNGTVKQYEKGFKETLGIGYKINEEYNFENNKLKKYTIGKEMVSEEQLKFDERYCFEDDLVDIYAKGIELTPEGKYKFDEEYIFQNDTVKQYEKDQLKTIESMPKKEYIFDDEYSYDDGIWWYIA